MGLSAGILIDITAKSLVLFAVCALLSVLMRKSSAAYRHALWISALVGLFCLPILSATLPRWNVHVLRPLAPVIISSLPSPTDLAEYTKFADIGTAGLNSPSVGLAGGAVAPTALSTSNPGKASLVRRLIPSAQGWVLHYAAMLHILASLCGVVSVFLIARMISRLVQVQRIVRTCLPQESFPAVEQARLALGVKRQVDVRVGQEDGSPRVPMTCGVWRPAVLLPYSSKDWTPDRMRAVVLHEMAHIKRLDWPLMILSELLCAIYWPNPLIWMANRRVRLESEKAADDLVLSSGMPPTDYASHLVEIARSLIHGERNMPAVAMASRPEISQRLSAILTFQGSRRELGPAGRVLSVGLLSFVFLVGAIHLAPQREVDRLTRALTPITRALHVELFKTFPTNATENSVVFTPDNTRVAAGSWSGTDGGPKSRLVGTQVYWSLASGRRLVQHNLTVASTSIAYSSNGRLLATGYAGGEVRITDTHTGTLLYQLQLPAGSVRTLQFSPDDLTVACGVYKAKRPVGLYLVDSQSGKLYSSDYRGIFWKLAKNWNGRGFAVEPQRWGLVSWDANINISSPLRDQPEINLSQKAQVCAAQGRLIAALNGDTVTVWDSISKTQLATIHADKASIGSHPHLAFSPNGQYLALGGRSTVRVWRLS